MFTGIIEQQGIVASLIRGSTTAKLAIAAPKIFDDSKVGDSLAIDGICLTATAVRRSFAEFDVSQETWKKTTLNDLRIGDKVNLEKALPLAGRLGGHLVTGHVDGMGEIREKVVNGEALDLYLSLPSDLLHYLVIKGSLAVDGISLTVADLRDGLVHIAVVPHTAKNTSLGSKGVGEKVNIEVDLISKYIEKHLKGEPRGVTDDLMVKMGFLPMGWLDN